MKKIYSYKIYGIIGSPIKHSLSPHMHNAAFAKLKIKAVYLPFKVEKNRLKETIRSLKQNRIAGFNVTIPFKSECMRYLDRIEPTAKTIGAVNTVVRIDNRFIGYNTDYLGFIRSLKEELRFNPSGKNIFIIGAGGAARAVSFALAKEGALRLYIYDTIEPKAKGLSRHINRNFQRCEAIFCDKSEIAKYIKDCQLLVNCTSLGMKKNDPLPVDVKLVHKGLKVHDIVYTPLRTELVKQANHRGVKAIGGVGMLLYQGAYAFQLWTKRKAPVAVMRRQLLDNLR